MSLTGVFLVILLPKIAKSRAITHVIHTFMKTRVLVVSSYQMDITIQILL